MALRSVVACRAAHDRLQRQCGAIVVDLVACAVPVQHRGAMRQFPALRIEKEPEIGHRPILARTQKVRKMPLSSGFFGGRTSVIMISAARQGAIDATMMIG